MMLKREPISYLCLYILLATTLVSCASLHTKNAVIEQEPISWPNRQQQLTDITSWDTQGAMRVRTPETGGSASINWEQRPDYYLIRLFGPFGAGQVQLEGRPNYVTLITSDKQKYTATSARTLLAQHTGWDLPISNLYYWIRGLPSPAEPAVIQFDDRQRPRVLQQEGWTIDYQQYTQVEGIDLPSRINLQNQDLKVGIVVSKWSI